MRPSATNAFPRFWNAYRIFHRAFPWIWIAGCVLCVIVSAMRLGHNWLTAVVLLTIYPAIIGWLAFNGIGLLLNLLPQLHDPSKKRPPLVWALIIAFLLVGVVFTFFAAEMTWALLRQI
jgi:amino acid transporter